MDNKERKMEDINKLITSINRQADESEKEHIRNYSINILTSLLGKSSQDYQEDPNFWKNKIMAKVEQNYDTRSILQCQEVCTRIINSNAIKKKS